MLGRRIRRKNRELLPLQQLEDQDSNLLEQEANFIFAASVGNIEDVMALHKGGIDINACKFLMTIDQKQVGIRKAKISFTEGFTIYETALSAAIKKGRDEIVCYLLNQGAETKHTYPFEVRKLIKLAHKLVSKNAYYYPCYADNLLPSACFSTIDHSTFKLILGYINDLNPIIHNYSGKLDSGQPRLISLLYFEYCYYKNKNNTTAESFLQKRLAYILCEAMLRFDEYLLSTKINYTELLKDDVLIKYSSNMEISVRQQENIDRSIDHLVENGFISDEFANTLRTYPTASNNTHSSSTRCMLEQMPKLTTHNLLVDVSSESKSITMSEHQSIQENAYSAETHHLHTQFITFGSFHN